MGIYIYRRGGKGERSKECEGVEDMERNRGVKGSIYARFRGQCLRIFFLLWLWLRAGSTAATNNTNIQYPKLLTPSRRGNARDEYEVRTLYYVSWCYLAVRQAGVENRNFSRVS